MLIFPGCTQNIVPPFFFRISEYLSEIQFTPSVGFKFIEILSTLGLAVGNEEKHSCFCSPIGIKLCSLLPAGNATPEPNIMGI